MNKTEDEDKWADRIIMEHLFYHRVCCNEDPDNVECCRFHEGGTDEHHQE